MRDLIFMIVDLSLQLKTAWIGCCLDRVAIVISMKYLISKGKREESVSCTKERPKIRKLTRGATMKYAYTRPYLSRFFHHIHHIIVCRELTDAVGWKVREEQVRWVVTVPAIWRQQAKQFMREAAYEAGVGSPSRPEQVLIALEPEAASIYCRRLRNSQLAAAPENR